MEAEKTRYSKVWVIITIVITVVIAISVFFSFHLNRGEITDIALSLLAKPLPLAGYEKYDSTEIVKIKSGLQREIRQNYLRLDNLQPFGTYIIINTTQNKFVLRNRKIVLREGVCSTGSYIQLESHDGKSWVFKTPKGMFRILGKIVDPVWIKPDWAFVEESLPIPPRNHPDRLEYGTLGDYALTLGDGYLIHGTLYQRFLGLPVTHGCVRLSDDDLEVVFHSLNIGSRVYIF